MKKNQKIRIEGAVVPGFESIRDLFERRMHSLSEIDTQLCVYHKGEKVVDLWASVIDSFNRSSGESHFSPNTLVNVFSSGKSFESIALASLAGKGLLNFNDKISVYWPEFSANGKESLTVADLMRHEAGLVNFDTPLEPEDYLTENIRRNKIGSIIERQSQNFPKGSGNARQYHAFTRGFIANELFRRIDPAGRTIGEYLRKDICEPLEIDVMVGVKKKELGRVKKVTELGLFFQFMESFKPNFMKRKTIFNVFQLLLAIIQVIPAIRAMTKNTLAGFKSLEYFNDTSIAMGEMPSANTHSNARSLAKIASVMSTGGRFKGDSLIDKASSKKEILSEDAWAALHKNPIEAKMNSLGSTTFTQAGLAFFYKTTVKNNRMEREVNEGREGFYGWMGAGGSIFQWHPEYEIGFGYVPTSLDALDLFNTRGKAYQSEMLQCVRRLRARDNEKSNRRKLA